MYLFPKWKETLPCVLNSSQTIYLANLDVVTDCVTIQNKENIDFYCDHKEDDTKMFAYIKFLCDNIRLDRVIIVSPDSDAAVMSLYQSVTNHIFFDAIWFKTGAGGNQRYIPVHALASEIGLPICCLLPAMHVISECDSGYIGKITTFQTFKIKSTN